MSTHAATAPTALPSENASGGANKALAVGIVGILLTAVGLFLPGNGKVIAMSWLVGLSFWVAIAIGMLLLVMIHHIFDASWSVVLRLPGIVATSTNQETLHRLAELAQNWNTNRYDN